MIKISKIKIRFDNFKKIITVSLLNNFDTVETYLKLINGEIDKLSYIHEEDLTQWRFNLYTDRLALYKDDLINMEELLLKIKEYNFKMIDVITAKPQYKYRMWLITIKNKHFLNYPMKILATNKILNI